MFLISFLSLVLFEVVMKALLNVWKGRVIHKQIFSNYFFSSIGKT